MYNTHVDLKLTQKYFQFIHYFCSTFLTISRIVGHLKLFTKQSQIWFAYKYSLELTKTYNKKIEILSLVKISLNYFHRRDLIARFDTKNETRKSIDSVISA